MTAHLIAKVVQSQFEKINLDDIFSQWKDIKRIDGCGRFTDEWVNRTIDDKQYYKWMKACYLLEEHIKRNFETFEQTELVYTWAKNLCIEKNNELNRWRQFGGYQTFSEFRKRARY
jgi:hypothetical protein